MDESNLEQERREFAAALKKESGRIDIGGNTDEFIANEFQREFKGWLLAKRAAPAKQVTAHEDLVAIAELIADIDECDGISRIELAKLRMKAIAALAKAGAA
jgi:hypothetical protein